MTNKEFFDRYAGQMIKYTYGDLSLLTCGESYRLCGYDTEGMYLLVETPGKFTPLKAYKEWVGGDTWVLLSDLTDDWRGIHCQLQNWEPPPRGPHAYICCRCGDPYRSKKDHRKVCKVRARIV